MKIIATRANNDGTFDEVGMNNRAIYNYSRRIPGYLRIFGRGKRIRLEEFGNGLYRDPTRVTFMEPD